MNTPEKKEALVANSPAGEAKATLPVETSATTEAVANDNAATAVEQKAEIMADAPAAKPYSKTRKFLSASFNIAAGAGLTALAKTGVAFGAATLAVPALGALVASAVAVGVVSTLWCHYRQNSALQKEGKDKQKFFSKKNAKVFGISAGFAAIGGALFLAFEDQFKSAATAVSNFVTGTPEVAVLPVVAPVEIATPTDHIADVIAANNVAADVKGALARSASENAVVAAQGTKDLAYYSFNGLGGMPKDQVLAVELFNKAADAGNVQAKVDMAFIQYHGLGGVVADKAAALSAVSELHTAKAEMFAKAWSAGVKAAAPVIAAPSV